MAPEQFAALATLLRLQDGSAREAARLVLVEEVKQADAARQTGISPSAVGNVLRTCRRGLELVYAAAGANALT